MPELFQKRFIYFFTLLSLYAKIDPLFERPFLVRARIFFPKFFCVYRPMAQAHMHYFSKKKGICTAFLGAGIWARPHYFVTVASMNADLYR